MVTVVNVPSAPLTRRSSAVVYLRPSWKMWPISAPWGSRGGGEAGRGRSRGSRGWLTRESLTGKGPGGRRRWSEQQAPADRPHRRVLQRRDRQPADVRVGRGREPVAVRRRGAVLQPGRQRQGSRSVGDRARYDVAGRRWGRADSAVANQPSHGVPASEMSVLGLTRHGECGGVRLW